MRDFFSELNRRDRVLAILGWFFLVLFAAGLVASFLDSRTVMGLNTWIKPMKFSLSLAIYVWTVAWFIGYFKNRPRRAITLIRWGVTLSLLLEVGLIFFQAARGTTSHFNVSTAFDGIIFGLMGNMIAIDVVLIFLMAARLTGQTIEIELLTRVLAVQTETACWVVEGAGGVLVPISDRHMMTDLMEALALPVVVVASSGLGTINHTLLTLEALRRRALHVGGVVMVGDANPENRAAIEQFGSVPVLGEMPRFARLTPERLGRWAQAELDPSGLLMEFLDG